MMKLFYVPGVCSIAPHAVLREGGFSFQLEKVDVKNGKRTESGLDYVALNPKGYVPALQLEDGRLLTEVAILIQYLADLRPGSGLAPPNGTPARYELQEWLHFIATELHKGQSVFYQPAATADLKAVFLGRLEARYALLARQVEAKGNQWLFGDTFTVADPYAFFVLRAYQKVVKADLSKTPALAAYYSRLAARPSIAAALAAEALEA
jgi:glutathione S-transferase